MQLYCDCMNLNGGYTVEVKQDEVASTNEDFPSKHFICSFIMLQAQKQGAPYAKFAGLGAYNLIGKFKVMFICAKNQDSNGTIFILANGSVPREDEEHWLYSSSDTFKMLDMQIQLHSLCQKVIKVFLML